VLTDGLTAMDRVQISGWMVAETRDTPYDGSATTANPLQERTRIRVYLLTGDIRLANRMGLQITVALPDVTRSAVVSTPATVFQFSETFRGLGDTSVIAWRRMMWGRWNAAINAGVSLPTGEAEMPRFQGTDDDSGSLVPASRLQRGTGTFDPIVGVSANRLVNRFFNQGFRAFVTGAARLPVAENEFGLRTGASWETSAGVSREVKWDQLVVIGRLSWLHREQDVFHGTPVLVGGGNWLAFAPSVSYTMDKLTLQTEFRLPLYRSLDNRQLDSSWTFQLGASWKLF
jgi:hypothetical protein